MDENNNIVRFSFNLEKEQRQFVHLYATTELQLSASILLRALIYSLEENRTIAHKLIDTIFMEVDEENETIENKIDTITNQSKTKLVRFNLDLDISQHNFIKVYSKTVGIPVSIIMRALIYILETDDEVKEILNNIIFVEDDENEDEA